MIQTASTRFGSLFSNIPERVIEGKAFQKAFRLKRLGRASLLPKPPTQDGIMARAYEHKAPAQVCWTPQDLFTADMLVALATEKGRTINKGWLQTALSALDNHDHRIERFLKKHGVTQYTKKPALDHIAETIHQSQAAAGNTISLEEARRQATEIIQAFQKAHPQPSGRCGRFLKRITRFIKERFGYF